MTTEQWIDSLNRDNIPSAQRTQVTGLDAIAKRWQSAYPPEHHCEITRGAHFAAEAWDRQAEAALKRRKMLNGKGAARRAADYNRRHGL